MKKTFTLLAALGVIAFGGSFLPAQVDRSAPSGEFMREKLDLSQKALEGVVVEDFEMVARNARRLGVMSGEAAWRRYEHPLYEEQSAQFRRNVNLLVKAAEEKNLDAATLAYLRVTMSCVECHKLVRGTLMADAAPADADGSVVTKIAGSQFVFNSQPTPPNHPTP